MAEDQKPNGPKKDDVGATPADLLSLWGAAPSPQAKASGEPEPSRAQEPPKAPESPPRAPELPKMPEPPKILEQLKIPEPPPPEPPKAAELAKMPEPPSRGSEATEAALQPIEAEVVEPEQPVESASAAEPSTEILEEKESFKQQLDEFLQELNLSKKHIFLGLGCIVLLVAFVFGGIAGWRYYKNRAQAPSQAPSQEPSEPKPPVETPVEIKPEQAGATGIAYIVNYGRTLEITTEFSEYVFLLRRLQNAYGTDINSLLNQATDKRGALKSHLALLRSLHGDAAITLKVIKEESELLQTVHDTQQRKQLEIDKAFFEELDSLNPQTTSSLLDEFIIVSREMLTLRSKFKALKKISSLYESSLPKVAARLQDIELNEEALISGIKVYDVRGSDLQLIIPAEGTSTVPETSLSYPSLPIDIGKHEKDFITSPGGGF